MEWRTVPGFSRYEVNEIGELRCTNPGPGQKASGPRQGSRHQGYQNYSVWADDIPFRRGLSAHRAVALAFLPPPEPGQTQVSHKNGIRWCNHYSNLAWATPAENAKDKIAHGRGRIPLRRNRKKDKVMRVRWRRSILGLTATIGIASGGDDAR